jgi:hypothetical protein
VTIAGHEEHLNGRAKSPDPFGGFSTQHLRHDHVGEEYVDVTGAPGGDLDGV